MFGNCISKRIINTALSFYEEVWDLNATERGRTDSLTLHKKVFFKWNITAKVDITGDNEVLDLSPDTNRN